MVAKIVTKVGKPKVVAVGTSEEVLRGIKASYGDAVISFVRDPNML